MDSADLLAVIIGPAFVMLLLALTIAAPAVLVALWRPWAAVPAAAAVGGLAYWYLGRWAAQRLRADGPVLLALMRSSRPSQPEARAVVRQRRPWLWTGLLVGLIALFPQALVPALMKLNGAVERVWFLALYLPTVWHWPVIGVMATIGVSAVAGSAMAFWTTRKGAPKGSTVDG